MKTNVTKPSRDAYHSLKNRGTKKDQMLKVAKRRKTFADFQLQQVLGWPINVITARRNELVESGEFVKLATTIKSPFGKSVTVYKVRRGAA